MIGRGSTSSRALVAGLAGAAALAIGFNPMLGRPSDFGGGFAVMPTRQVDEEADRRRRNLAAGGRDKRIAKNKARRSYPNRCRRLGPAVARYGRLFKSDAREAAFGSALALGKSRNEAAKIARRVAA